MLLLMTPFCLGLTVADLKTNPASRFTFAACRKELFLGASSHIRQQEKACGGGGQAAHFGFGGVQVALTGQVC